MSAKSLAPWALAIVFAGMVMFAAPAGADDYKKIKLYWNISAPGANTDAITNISWGNGEACRVTVQLATESVVNLMVSRGGTEKALGLNGSVALKAGSLYTFDVHGMQALDIVNIQSETDSVWDKVDVGRLVTDQ